MDVVDGSVLVTRGNPIIKAWQKAKTKSKEGIPLILVNEVPRRLPRKPSDDIDGWYLIHAADLRPYIAGVLREELERLKKSGPTIVQGRRQVQKSD
jgi:hypothetical protein